MIDRRIKLRHVETFVEIARRGSLKEAARALNLTQPAVSRTLKELEQALGTTLMARNRGGVSLTPQGEVFRQHGDIALAALGQAVRMADQSSAQSGSIAVGALPSVAAHVLPRALMTLAARAPGTQVRVTDGPHGYLVEQLRTGELDIVVGRLGAPDTMRGLSFTQLYTEHVVIAAAAGHPLAGCSHLADLAAHPIIYPSEDAAIRPLVDRQFLAAGISTLPNRTEAISHAFGRSMTLETGTLWLISQGVVANDVAAGHLVVLPVDMSLTAGPVGIMTRAEEDASPIMRLLRSALFRAVDGLNLG